jgi:ATP adenylyltransferase
MDILHAYWRMDYIQSVNHPEDGKGNPFAVLPGLGDDRKALIVHRGRHTYLVLNRYPYNPGHILVVPFREVPDVGDLSPEERLELMDMIVLAQDTIRKAMNPDAFNVGYNLGQASGAGIPAHLHVHVVPRWNGDTNFLSVIGETKSLPQALDKTWEVLKSHLPDA